MDLEIAGFGHLKCLRDPPPDETDGFSFDGSGYAQFAGRVQIRTYPLFLTLMVALWSLGDHLAAGSLIGVWDIVCNLSNAQSQGAGFRGSWPRCFRWCGRI